MDGEALNDLVVKKFKIIPDAENFGIPELTEKGRLKILAYYEENKECPKFATVLMKRFLLLIISLFFIIAISSQSTNEIRLQCNQIIMKADKFLKISNADSSIFYYNKSLSIAKKNNFEIQKFQSYLGLSKSWQKSKRLFKSSKSNRFAERALKLLDNSYDKKYFLEINFLLYTNYEQMGDIQNSKIYLLKYDKLNSDLENEIVEKELDLKNSELEESKLKIEETNDKLNLINQTKDKQEVEIKNAKVKLYRVNKTTKKQTIAIDSLENDNELLAKDNELLAKDNELLAKDNEILEKGNELKNLKLESEKAKKEKIILITFIIGAASIILLILLIIIFRLFRIKREMNIELEILNETKDKFFSIISHDLKSPIRSIKSLTDLLLKKYDNFDDNKKKDIINKTNDSASSLYGLLENLLEWSRSQSGKIDFSPEMIDINVITNDTIKLFKNSAYEKEIELVNSIDSEAIVYADKNMITTVFRNIISNAIKFTEIKGQITVSFEEDEDEDEDSFIFNIQDSGIGMTEDTIDKLFKVEAHITTKGTNGEPGTGLGLVLCKEFVEKNNGKIWVTSTLNEGSTFSMSFKKRNEQKIKTQLSLKTLLKSVQIISYEAIDKIYKVSDNTIKKWIRKYENDEAS